MTVRKKRLSFLALVLLAVAGCGKAMYPVRGQIVWSDGTPARELAGGSVGFNSEAADLSARGEIEADATFSLSSLKKDDGLPPGVYQVTIAPAERESTPDASSEAAQGRKLLPARYQSYETTDLQATVEAKENRLTLTIERAKPEESEPAEEPASQPQSEQTPP